MHELKEVYDTRYSGEYRERLGGYEIARWKALDHFISHVLAINAPNKVLDYGAGAGLHVGLWEKIFPQSELHFCDISSVAKDKLILKYPQYAKAYRLVNENHVDFGDNTFNIVVSVEVMEHVEDLKAYLHDIYRVLKPGAKFVWTTPCANNYSIEHLFSLLTGQIRKTEEGFRRWRWEDPAHLRRLKSREIKAVLEKCGFNEVVFRFRAHFFSFICSHCFPPGLFKKFRADLMTLDYRLFSTLSNGASMLGAATKPKKLVRQ